MQEGNMPFPLAHCPFLFKLPSILDEGPSLSDGHHAEKVTQALVCYCESTHATRNVF